MVTPPRILLLSSKCADPELEEIRKQAISLGFQSVVCSTLRQALQEFGVECSEERRWPVRKQFFDVVVTKLGGREDPKADRLDTARGVDLLRVVRLLFGRQTFVLFHSRTACRDPLARWHLFQTELFGSVELTGCNMVSDDLHAINQHVLKPISEASRLRETSGACYSCPWCGMTGLTVRALWMHAPLYHTNESPKQRLVTSSSKFLLEIGNHLDQAQVDQRKPTLKQCSICQKDVTMGALQKHIMQHHGPKPCPPPPSKHLSAFALVVCIQEDRILLVQERGNSGYWLPGGHVDGSESLTKGALRETWEEAGVRVELTGILQVQYHPVASNHVRLRVIFLAKPVQSTWKCKTVPDYESTAATWAALDSVDKLWLRNSEPTHWVKYLKEGGVVHSMSVLSDEER